MNSDFIKKSLIRIQGAVLGLAMIIAAFAMPQQAEAAQTPGVVDGIDLDLGGMYYAFPGFVSQCPDPQKKATKRVVAIYVYYYDSYIKGSDKLSWIVKYDDKGRVSALHEVFGSPDDISWKYTYEYDTNGRMVRKNSISGSGEMSGWTIYDYDEQGHLIKMSSYSKQTGDNPGSYFNYSYENGRVVATDGWASMGGETSGSYVYDERGNLIQEIREGAVVSEFEYDDLNRPVKHITYSTNGKSIIQENILSYDSDGYLSGSFANNVLESYVYESIESPQTKPTLKYSASGNGKITLKWSKVKGATGYTLYKRKYGSETWTKVKTTKKRKLTEAIDQSGQMYQYLLKAYIKKNGKKVWIGESYIITTRLIY